MPTVKMTMELPEDLVRDARELGILNQETLVELLRQEIDQRVMALVNDEIHAYRAEKRQPQDPKQIAAHGIDKPVEQFIGEAVVRWEAE